MVVLKVVKLRVDKGRDRDKQRQGGLQRSPKMYHKSRSILQQNHWITKFRTPPIAHAKQANRCWEMSTLATLSIPQNALGQGKETPSAGSCC